MDPSDLDFGLHIETARLQGFLAQLLRSQETIQKRQDDLASAFDELLKKLASGEQGIQEHQQTLQKLQNDTERLSERVDALDKLRIREKIERYDSDHNELKSFQSQISLLDSKIKSQESTASNLQGRLVDIESKQSNLDDQFKEMLPEFGSLKAGQTAAAVQCQAAEARCTEVERRQEELANSVENKYENLWRGVEQSLEAISTAELQKYQSDIQALSGKVEKRINLRISYCLDILTKATEMNRQRDVKRSVLLRWREQAWLASRRKFGLSLLASRIYSRVRSFFRRWFYQARWASEIERVKEEFKKLVPDVDAVLAGTVNPRLQLLEEGAAAEARKTELLVERNKEVWSYLQSTMDRALALEHKTKEGTEALERMSTDIDRHANFRRDAEERVQSAEAMVTQLSEQFALLARDDDVKNMMKDILLIWTAVKQLDAAKADRKELENLGVETTAKNETLSESVQKLEDYNTVQDNKARHEELEFMFGLVVRLVEDIANIQFGKMQARLATSGRAGIGRVEARPTLRKPISRANETSAGAPKISMPVSFLAGENDGTERGGDNQIVSDIRSKSKPNADCKLSQPSLQPHLLPDFKNKQFSRSPAVAAFADWVSDVQKALKLEYSPSDFSGTQAHASR
ncbi:uncharacterized protein EMH_0093010 [Eimeria mitis]|uniref:Uncharacterized protein n=1 Tax=Eimeria mitis TaxID=44415 RepID=U6K736_9EIME|nr:uncharacterized protein EMH_0093010 [Eimeria mitis]CDJ33779.1 hypothetical protein, conserved [Eimeria mitis]